MLIWVWFETRLGFHFFGCFTLHINRTYYHKIAQTEIDFFRLLPQNTDSLSHTLTHTLSHIRTHTLSLSHTHTRTHTQIHTYTHTHKHIHIHTRTHFLSLTRTHTRARTHAHTHTPTHPKIVLAPPRNHISNVTFRSIALNGRISQKADFLSDFYLDQRLQTRQIVENKSRKQIWTKKVYLSAIQARMIKLKQLRLELTFKFVSKSKLIIKHSWVKNCYQIPTVCIRDLDWTLEIEPRWCLLYDIFVSLLTTFDVSFFRVAGALAKICLA